MDTKYEIMILKKAKRAYQIISIVIFLFMMCYILPIDEALNFNFLFRNGLSICRWHFLKLDVPV